MKTLSLQIPGMQSEHCRIRVGRALSGVSGIEVEKLEPGHALLKAEDHDAGSRAIESIKMIGYEVTPEDVLDPVPSDDEFRFATNLNCQACVAQVAHSLDTADGICHWSVDTKGTEKELIVHSEGISAEQVMEIVRSHGFSIRRKEAASHQADAERNT